MKKYKDQKVSKLQMKKVIVTKKSINNGYECDKAKALLREALAWCLYYYTQYHVESFDLFYSQKEISFWSDKSNKRIEYYNKVSKEVMDKLYNMLIDLKIKVEKL